MNNILLAGGLLVAGIFVLDRLVPKPSQIAGLGTAIKTSELATKKYEEIGYKEAKAGDTCIEDTNCTGFSLLGGDAVCRQGKCDPLVKTDSLGQIKYAAYDLGLPIMCGKKYVLGVGMKCVDTKQCSADGNLYDATDPSALSATVSSKHYCANDGTCKQKVKDWAGIYWKQEDPLAPPAGKGGTYDQSNWTNVIAKGRALESSCKDVKNYMPSDYPSIYQ